MQSHSVESVSVIDQGSGIKVSWSDGISYRYHALWLRDNALDVATRSPANGQRLITLADIPKDLKISNAQILGDTVELSFSPESKLVEFPQDWLRQHAYDKAAASQVDELLPAHVKRWSNETLKKIPSATYQGVTTNSEALREWLGAVRRYGFAKVTHGPMESGALLRIVDAFGFVRATNYGQWFEVRTEVNPSNLAYTGLGLQAHTDNPYRDPVPTLQILYCLENSASGGESQVVDGFEAAFRLKELHPEYFDLLSGYSARFDYQGANGVRLKATRPMIELSVSGELQCVRFNNRSTAPIVDVPYEKMAAYYEAYSAFGEIIDSKELAVNFKLEPGDSFIVDNTRVLHGRTGYQGQGDRWLQGCYADKDGLNSTYTALCAQEA